MPSSPDKQECDGATPCTPATTVVTTPSPPSPKSASIYTSLGNAQHPPSPISLPRHDIKTSEVHKAPQTISIISQYHQLPPTTKGSKSIYDVFYDMNPMKHPLNPHPHLTQPVIWVNMYPPDLSEQALADAVQGCLPIRVKLDPAVPPEMRLLPEMYYDWMSKTGTIEFTSLALAERALAVLVNHTTFTPKGIWFSSYPPPYLLPTPDPPTAVRYIRPTTLMLPPNLLPNPRPEDAFRAYFPTPSEVYDAIRPWGSIRSVNSYITEADTELKQEGENKVHQWLARVEFWYEDEAKRFDVGFGQNASLLKGWRVYIHASMPEPVTPAIPNNYQPPPRMLNQPHEPLQIDTTNIQYIHPPADPPQMGIMYIPDPMIPPTPTSTTFGQFPVMGYDQIPQTPPAINYVSPWAGHNMFAASDMSPENYAESGIVPMTPDRMGRRMSRTSMSSMDGRGRTWSLTVGESPDGELRPTGLVADDGTIIQHGPGQHIRPAPYFGPGSNSVSGLVDYSNVFVKNLDPDINSYYLEEVFSHVGQVVSARVMRDDSGRSRGYGFVSFNTPEQAATAIATLHNQKLGRSIILVTLHEPRKLRPEKIAERVASGLPVSYGRHSSSVPRRSMSPVRTDRNDRRRESYADDKKPPGDTDELRSLSPSSRKQALAKKISGRVRNYARSNNLSDDQVESALNALVQQDLSLIPLLHDKAQLDLRIAEAFSNPSSDQFEGTVGPTNEDLIKLREEVRKIDPANVNEIMPVMLEMLSPSDWESLWTQQRVARKYGLAKQSLLKNREGEDETDLVDIETGNEVKQDDTPAAITQDLVSLEELTISSFCALPATRIMLNLHSNIGEDILAMLSIKEPTLTEKNDHVSLINKNMNKNKVERGVEIASLLGKKIDIDTLKRSQKLKMIKGLINAEDEKALCELMLYPALLNAKVKSFVETQDGFSA